MQAHQFFLSSVDNHRIFVRSWMPEAGTPRAIIQILHGMAEHCSRYEPVATLLVRQGYGVIAHDHRGHGHSVPQGGLLGHYADHGGWKLVLADTYKVNEYIHKQHPDLPVVLVGHSMGSFIALGYLIQHGRTVDAAVLSGSTANSPMAIRSARMLAQLEKLRAGAKARSSLIDLATFSSYNRQVSKQPRTEYDWLSRDEREVDKYIHDPLCGFLCTNQLWLDLTGGLETISRISNLRKIPHDLPFYLVAGERDPLSYSNSHNGVDKLAGLLREGGIRQVTVKLYQGGRHEIFNETNREEVIGDLLKWLAQQLPVQQPQNSVTA